MHTKEFLQVLTLGAGMFSLPATAATVKLSAEAQKVFTEVCSVCHVQFEDAEGVAAEASEIIKRLDPKAPEDIRMPPSYGPDQISNEVKARIIKELQKIK